LREESQEATVRALLVAGLGLAITLGLSANAGAEYSDYGLASVSASLSTTQAGAHPDFTTAFELKTDPASPADTNGLHEPYARTRDITVSLPPGLIGNPNAVGRCTTLQLTTAFDAEGGGCPFDSQVGVAVIRLYNVHTLVEPVYNMETPGGDTVARLGFLATTLPNYINVEVRSESDYGLTATLEGVPANEKLVSAVTTLWAVPAASTHDTERLTPREAFLEVKSESPPREFGLAPAPFMTNPTSCGEPQQVGFATDSYQLPGQFSEASAALPAITGCGLIAFDPRLSVTPTNTEAAAPTGLDATLKIPQDETVGGRAASELRYATVTLPEGVTIAPGAADGLEACSAEQVGLETRNPAACPGAAKIGSAEFDVPALSRVLHGAVYQRTPQKGDLFGIWLVTDELGVHVKIPGDVHADAATGQLTTVFAGTSGAKGNPQVPLREFKLHFKGGPHGVLATPGSCGVYRTHYEFTPWSGGAPAVGDTPMTIDEGCDTGGFEPRLVAGTVNPSAGAFSALVTNLTRDSGEENVSSLDVTMPPGVLAKLAGVPLCEGAATASGDCPAASHLGTTTVATGPGPSPLWIPQAGKDPTAVYLSGPYKGAPYSLVVKTPAQAGPFDLGTVVVRAGIYVDPETTAVTVKSDPLPQILEGVPISYRTIHVDVDRSQFTINPTSCRRMEVQATVSSGSGRIASPTDRFQVGGCSALGFKPRLSLRLFGRTTRAGHPRLRAVLRARPGDANIARVSVALPRSEFLDQGHIGTICTRVQFAADQCPEGSIYGQARAFSPLLDRALEGPVYLRSSNHELPDLVIALHGQVDVDLAGRIDSVNGGIRTTFAAVPDAPVTKFILTMQGGRRGLLQNSRNLCAAPSAAAVAFDAQNGKGIDRRPRVKNACRRG
jgi:hypothetical protein